MRGIDILKQNRNYMSVLVSGLDEKSLLFIPKGFKTNILWNLGHILVTQQMLHYSLAGKRINMPPPLRKLFQKESSPARWVKTPDVEQVKSLFLELPGKLQEDYEAGIFTEYQEFITMTGYRLSCIEDAIEFNNFHEGYHAGIIHSFTKIQ
ncbi:MAG: DinB family protein [Leptospirales bacterium]